MISPAEERRVHKVFIFSIAIKAADAVLEILAAVVLAVFDAGALTHPIMRLLAKELLHHPEDRLAAWAMHLVQGFSLNTKTFAALYLASHGAIKLFLMIGLWRNQAWAYPVSLVAFAAFIVYQLYRFTFTQSVFLIVLTVFDLIVIVLIWHEWWMRKAAGTI